MSAIASCAQYSGTVAERPGDALRAKGALLRLASGRPAVAVAGGGLVGILDEWLVQARVPGRHPDPIDLLAENLPLFKANPAKSAGKYAVVINHLNQR